MPDSLETGLALTLVEQIGDERRCRQARTARTAGQSLAQMLRNLDRGHRLASHTESILCLDTVWIPLHSKRCHSSEAARHPGRPGLSLPRPTFLGSRLPASTSPSHRTTPLPAVTRDHSRRSVQVRWLWRIRISIPYLN